MEAILKFNLPDDEYEFHCAGHGVHYRCIIEASLNLFRNYIKYNDSLTGDQRKILEELKAEIINEIEGYGLTSDFY